MPASFFFVSRLQRSTVVNVSKRQAIYSTLGTHAAISLEE